MDPQAVVFDFKPVSDLAMGLNKGLPIAVVDQFLLKSAHKSLSQAVWGRLTSVSHADTNVISQQQISVVKSGVLNALVRMMNERTTVLQGHT